jgi:endonuclease/exonuclease/phosphatase family metal-dependent hydrolase
MITRRTFLATVAAATALPSVAAAQEGRFRSISYNVLACGGYPHTPQNGARLAGAEDQMVSRFTQELRLYQSDLVSFSESVLRPDAERAARLLDMNFAWFEPGVPSYKGYPIGFPGTVFTRHEIVESENAPYAPGRTRNPDLFTRHWGRAVIKTPIETIAFFSGHLNPQKQDVRMAEITEILAVMEPVIKSGRSVLFHGDLNHRPETPEYERWVAAGLVDSFAAKGTGQPFTSNSIEPRGRIDYIWAAGPLATRLKDCHALFEGAFRTNPADPTSFALSDHLPVLADFGGAA